MVAMRVEYINPFVESVYDFFSTMLGAEVARGNPALTQKGAHPRHMMAMIGLSGPARGTVALSFPKDTILSICTRLLGEELILESDIADALAEVVNIVAGGAKAKLYDAPVPIDLSLPTVVTGEDFHIRYPSDSVWLDVPFTSDLGPFNLRVTFEFTQG